MPGLADSVLVLNRSWHPIGVVRARKAIGLVAVERAAIVCTETYGTFSLPAWAQRPPRASVPRIRAVCFAFDRPEVIVLSRQARHVPLAIRFSRRAVFRRDGHACVYCGCKPGLSGLTIDHVLPRSRGGKTNWENCVTACGRCNVKKGDGLPGDRVPRLKRRPRRPHWTALLEGHTSWSSFLKGSA